MGSVSLIDGHIDDDDIKMNNSTPNRCISPVIKFCQDCEWGWVKYPAWVETAEDTEGCVFEAGCTLGYDKGRPEDEPTKEEIEEFEKWFNGEE